ncbi:GNAT family N-acetyltransferase [Streptomyces sp. NPDC060000]|uniref:GNAT family N-acetyltransferase n=1 Tax=Streptomyces sp. NPDC060000 TaxID=3347031 RepID=UPI0036744B5A
MADQEVPAQKWTDAEQGATGQERTARRVSVRAARAADIPGLVASSAGLFAEDAGTRDPGVDAAWPRAHGAASFAAALENPSRLVLVAERAGQVVGHLTGSLTEPSAMRPVKSATLISMYVQPTHRGDGAGAQLVAAFFAWAAEQGARRTEVTAYTDNADAIRFYERHGFCPHSVTLSRPL